MRFITLCYIAFSLLSLNLYPQEDCFQQITDAHVLSIEESFEFIWMGTLEDGLLKYNKFTGELSEYNMTNSALPTNKINSVFRYGGLIVFSADTGIYEFQGLNIVEKIDSIGGEIGVTTDGDMIVAGNIDYHEFDDGSTIVYEKNLMEVVSLSCEMCEKTTDLVRTLSGDIWLSHFSFYEFDILQFDGENWTLHDINTTNGVLPIESYSTANRLMSYDGKIYASAVGQVYVFDNEEWSNTSASGPFIITPEMETLNTAVTDLERDNDVGFWVGSGYDYITGEPGRLAYFDGNNWDIYDIPAEDNTSVIRIYSSYIVEGALYVGTSNGLFILDEDCLGVNGISELQSNQMLVYPNPSDHILHFNESVTSEITITNMNGQIMKSYNEGLRNNIVIDMLQPGTYSIKFSVNDEEINSKFIVLK